MYCHHQLMWCVVYILSLLPLLSKAIPDTMLDLHEITRVVTSRENLVFELLKANNENVLTLKASCDPVSLVFLLFILCRRRALK